MLEVHTLLAYKRKVSNLLWAILPFSSLVRDVSKHDREAFQDNWTQSVNLPSSVVNSDAITGLSVVNAGLYPELRVFNGLTFVDSSRPPSHYGVKSSPLAKHCECCDFYGCDDE